MEVLTLMLMLHLMGMQVVQHQVDVMELVVVVVMLRQALDGVLVRLMVDPVMLEVPVLVLGMMLTSRVTHRPDNQFYV